MARHPGGQGLALDSRGVVRAAGQISVRTIVVVPTYNEAENLPRLVPALLAHGPPDLELLIVDDASPDGTGQCADELARAWPGRMTVLHRRGPRGLGHAYLEGIRVALDAGADVVGQMDADLSHPPEAMPSLLAALERHEAVIGSRYVQGGRVDPRWPLWRKALSAFGNFYARTILGMSVHDVTGGYRLYRRTALLRMPLARVSSNGYVFQVEMTYIAT